MRKDTLGRKITPAKIAAVKRNLKKAMAARWPKAEKQAAPKPNGHYGKEVYLQIPVGRHETRSLTIKQAGVMYRHLHSMRWVLR